MKQNQVNAEYIVLKLKELKHSLANIWATNVNSFLRDIFDLGP
jgi:hypothetical protein